MEMPSLENEKTELLFWKDPYLVEFEAKIIEKSEKGLILDRTAFYPEGGGQFSDEGYLLLPNNEKILVEKVDKINGKIFHVIAKKDLLKIEIGIKVKGGINWEKRYNIMKAHTSQHILSAMIVKNAKIETAKAIISNEEVTIHLTKKIPNELLKKSIIETNSLLLKGISIESNFFTKENLPKQIKGKLRGNIDNITTDNLRVVSVNGIDHSLCGGTHVKNTSEIGFLAVVDFKGDIIYYKFGEQAINFNATLNVETISTAKLLASKSEEVNHRISKILLELEEIRETNSQLSKIVLHYQINESKNSPLKIGSLSIIHGLFPFAQKKFVLQELGDLSANQIAILVVNGPMLIVVTSADTLSANSLIKEFCEKTGNKGGGSETIAQASINNVDMDMEIIFDILKQKK